jgi:PPM family protein phosphatase
MLTIDVQTLSRQGGRDYQEDSFGHSVVGDLACLVVADGAGGHGGGHIASQLAVRAVNELHARQNTFSPSGLSALLLHAHNVVLAGQQSFAEYPDMRSTLVVALIHLESGKVLVGNVGDSRGYVFRGGKLAGQTRDHSVVQHMVDQGLISAEQSQFQPQRNLLLASLGMQGELQSNLLEPELPLSNGDVLFLCTDGMWDCVGPQDVEHALAQGWGLVKTLEHFDSAVMLGGKPGHDNYTGLIAQLMQVEQPDFEATVLLQAPIVN